MEKSLNYRYVFCGVCVCVCGEGGGCVRACVCIKARLSCLDQETQKDPHRLTNLLLVMRPVTQLRL